MENNKNTLMNLLTNTRELKQLLASPKIKKSVEYCEYLELYGAKFKYEHDTLLFMAKVYESDDFYILETLEKDEKGNTLQHIKKYYIFKDVVHELGMCLLEHIKINPMLKLIENKKEGN